MYYLEFICFIVPPILIYIIFRTFSKFTVDKSSDKLIINFTNCYYKSLHLETCICSLCIIYLTIIRSPCVFWLSLSHYTIMTIHDYFNDYEQLLLHICTLYCTIIWIYNENMRVFGYGFLFIWNAFMPLNEILYFHKKIIIKYCYIWASIYVSGLPLLFVIFNTEYIIHIDYTIYTSLYLLNIIWITFYKWSVLFNEYKKIKL